MDAKEYLESKVVNDDPKMGYEDWLHYCDCRHEEQMAIEVPLWMEEYHTLKSDSDGKRKYGISEDGFKKVCHWLRDEQVSLYLNEDEIKQEWSLFKAALKELELTTKTD